MSVKFNVLGILFNVSIMVLNLSSNTEARDEKIHAEVNFLEHSFKQTDRALSGYNGIQDYMCKEGDFIDYTCKAKERGEIRLQYYDAFGNIVFERPNSFTGNEDRLRFLKSMRVQDNNSYVDCTYVKTDREFQEFTYRTVFIVKDMSFRDDDIIVTINSTKLLPERLSNKELNIHRYMFIDGSILDVTCKLKSQQDSINLTMRNKVTIQELKTPGPYELRFLVNTKKIIGNYFYCSSAGKRTAVIQFRVDRDRDVFVLGLPENGILYQYSQSSTEWIIHYEYKTNEMLNLQCVTKGDRIPYWNNKLNEKKRNPNGMIYVTLPIVLNDAQNIMNITCYSKKNKTTTQKTTIYFHQNTLDTEEFTASKNKQNLFIYIGYGLVVLIATISAVWAYGWWMKKRKASKRQCPYEYINEDNPIPPFPAQWNENEYSYIVTEYDDKKDNVTNEYATIESAETKNIDNVIVNNSMYLDSEPQYTVPYNSTNDNVENPYTEIDDNFTNKMKSKLPEPYEKFEIKSMPSTSNTSQGNNSNRDLQREDSNEIYNNLFLGTDKESYVSFRNSNVLYKNIFEARQSNSNEKNLSN